MDRSDEHAVNPPPSRRRWMLLSIVTIIIIASAWFGFSMLRTSALRRDIPDLPAADLMAQAVAQQVNAAHANALADPGDPETVGRLAMVLHANGFDNESRETYAVAQQLNPDDFRWPYLRAVQLIRLGRNDQALPLLETAIALDPNAAHAWARLGELMSAKSDTERATECFNKAIALVPNHTHAVLGLAQLAGRAGDWQTAVDLLLPAVKDNLSFGSGNGYLAAAYRNLGQDAQAERYEGRGADTGFQMADPTLANVFALSSNGDILLIQAKLAELQGDPDRAVTMLTRGVRVAPEHKDLRLALGNLYSKFAETDPTQADRAIAQFEAGLKLDPGYDRMRYGLAYAHVLANEPGEAMRIWKALLEDEPEHAIAMSNMGQLYLRLGNFTSALKYLLNALEIPPDTPFSIGDLASVHHHLALTYIGLERYDEAESSFRASIADNPDKFESYVDHAAMLRMIERPEDAIAIYMTALTANPESAELFFACGEFMLQLQRFESAEQLIRRSLELSGDNPLALAALGHARMQQGDFDSAIMHLQQAISQNPTLFVAHYQLGYALLNRGRKAEAIASFNQALQLNPTFQPALDALSIAQQQP